MLLYTMPKLTWVVSIKNLLLVYRFLQTGRVTWQDPFVRHQGGAGSWKVDKGLMTIKWDRSKETDEWNVPMNPQRTTGVRRSASETVPLTAEAQDYYLYPGAVVSGVGDPVKGVQGLRAAVVYDGYVRTGGTIAWICSNPGNIMNPGGQDFGAIPGKSFHIKVRTQQLDGTFAPADAPFAIFPNEDVGFKAVVSWLRAKYQKNSILNAMKDYAPPGHGGNRPEVYAARVAADLGVSVDTKMSSLSEAQLVQMAKKIKAVEASDQGRELAEGNPDLPAELRGRLSPGKSEPRPSRWLSNDALPHTQPSNTA